MRMPYEALAACAVLILSDLGSATDAAAKAKIIEFDPPHSFHTLIFGHTLNEKGDVTGFYFKGNGRHQYAFIRTSNGDFVDTAEGLPEPLPRGINAHEATIGQDRPLKGYITAKDGSVVTFRVRGTDNTGYGTRPIVIDDNGNIVGHYTNPLEFNWHGFVRKANGKIRKFDAPNGGTQRDQGTYISGMNSSGYISGWVVDENSVAHGYLGAPDGTFTIIDMSNAGTGPNQGTRVTGLNENGAVSGYFVNLKNRSHGFLRDFAGNIIFINVNKAGNDEFQGTTAVAINNNNDVAGSYEDAASVRHGFVRLATGKIKKFDAPDALLSFGTGTNVEDINDRGEISGYFDGTDHHNHGFLRKP